MKAQVSRSLRRSLAPLVLGLCVWLVLPAQAFARALVRFIHAVPGVGTATVTAGAGSARQDFGSIGFAQVTPWHSIRSGSFRWVLSGGGKTLAQGTSTVGDGAYDLVVLAETSGVRVGVYKASAGKPGSSLLRVIHAAPELGSPALELDSHAAVPSLGFTQATPYLSVAPGVHSLGAMRAGDSTPLVSVPAVKLSSGVAYSAIVLGSRGERVRVVTVVDRGAPLTRTAAPRTTHGHSPSAGSDSSVVVRHGDSLWSIARSTLPAGAGDVAVERRVIEIWNLNAIRIGTGDPNLIFAGQRLRLS